MTDFLLCRAIESQRKHRLHEIATVFALLVVSSFFQEHNEETDKQEQQPHDQALVFFKPMQANAPDSS